MSALPGLAVHFLAMERLVEAQPENVVVEIARGVYATSPRPRGWHGAIQGRLFARLDGGLGSGSGHEADEWFFVIEPEIRSPEAFSWVVPDLAGWRRSADGWSDLDTSPISRIPDWVAEVLSPATEPFDCGPKREAYGLMGVGWLWILDPGKRTVETFSNVRSRMTPGPVFASGDEVLAPPRSTGCGSPRQRSSPRADPRIRPSGSIFR